MSYLVVAYLGGVLTILGPCILPVLPFVFARAGRSFAGSTLPMLVGMALTFTLVAAVAAVGGGWVVEANRYGRDAAIALLAFFGVTLLSPRAAAFAARPFAGLGSWLLPEAGRPAATVGGSLMLGIATGLLWTPCAGPILGLVLTEAALAGPDARTVALLSAYAAGAATSLAGALLVGGRVLRRALGAGEGLRRGLGVAVLAGVAAIGLGVDTTAFARIAGPGTDRLEQALLDRLGPKDTATADGATPLAMIPASGAAGNLPDEGPLPALDGAVQWLNSPPLTPGQLRGKVVLVDFWTYSCINCIRTLPYVRAWAEKYRDAGLVVIGVHTPEFAFERQVGNVERAIADFRLDFPVAVDSNSRIWRAFGNRYWPAWYLVDADGRIRYHHFGEGAYAKSEQAIRALLAEAGSRVAASPPSAPAGTGAEAAADLDHLRSGETYVGYAETSNFASPGGLKPDAPYDYTAGALGLNEWALAGNWTVRPEAAVLNRPDGRLTFRFSARDLNLVLGPGADGKPVRFEVRVDGKAPDAGHGVDIDAAGHGTVGQTRLYQLVRQAGDVAERTFEIRFLDPGVEAFVFTFG